MPALTNVHTFAEYSNAFTLGLSAVHSDNVKRMPRDYKVWLSEQRADHFYDTEWKTSDVGIMPEKEIGGVVETDKIYQGPTKQFDISTYALGIVIQYEAMRWDLYGVFKNLMKGLVKSAVDRYNVEAYAILMNGFSAANLKYATYQGEALFTDSHTRLDGGSWSNAGTVGISYLGFQEARTELQKTVNERGLFMADVNPRLVITSPDQEWVAETILQSVGRPGTADNDINTLSKKGYTIKTSPYITNASYWWLWDKNAVEISLRLGDDPFLQFDNELRAMNRFGVAYCSFGVRVWDSKGAWGSSGGG